MTYQPAAPPPAPPYPPTPGYGYAPPPPKQRRGGLIVGLAAAALIAGVLGGGIGAFAANDTHQNAAPAADTHAQDIQLCTAFATINSAMPSPPKTALEVLPGVNGLRLAVAEAPNANPEIRSALTDLIQTYDEMIAWFGKVRSRGLASPHPYDRTQAKRIYDQAWDVCQLGN